MLNDILERNSCHLSIVNIKANLTGRNNVFQYSKAEPPEILKLMKGTKSGTSVGVNNIKPRLVVRNYSSNLINAITLAEQIFPDVEKKASVTPAFRKEERQTETNYRLINVLMQVSI